MNDQSGATKKESTVRKSPRISNREILSPLTKTQNFSDERKLKRKSDTTKDEERHKKTVVA